MLYFFWNAAQDGVLVVTKELAGPLLLIVIIFDHVFHILLSTRVREGKVVAQIVAILVLGSLLVLVIISVRLRIAPVERLIRHFRLKFFICLALFQVK